MTSEEKKSPFGEMKSASIIEIKEEEERSQQQKSKAVGHWDWNDSDDLPKDIIEIEELADSPDTQQSKESADSKILAGIKSP